MAKDRRYVLGSLDAACVRLVVAQEVLDSAATCLTGVACCVNRGEAIGLILAQVNLVREALEADANLLVDGKSDDDEIQCDVEELDASARKVC